jgi:transcriptional regulator of acetoin/glycerol metabolism
MSFALDDPSLASWPFHEQSHHLKLMRPAIQKSLQRCWPRLYLDQDTHVSSSELSQILEANSKLLSIVEPVMDEISDLADDYHTAFVLVDRSGYLIRLQGCSHITPYLRERGIDLGTDLSEYGSGTNAFGLALIELVPIELEGEEHFLQKFKGLFDAAAPIFDPAAHLIGAIGVIGLLENKRPQSLALAMLAARAITEGVRVHESAQENALQKERFDQVLATNQVSVLVLDGDGCIDSANPASESLLGIERSKLVGRSFHEVIQLPAELRTEMDAHNEIHELETTIRLKRRPVNCVISFIPFPGGQGSVLYLRQPEEIWKLAIRELSSQGDFGLKDILGVSPQIRGVRRQVKSAAQAKASILIVGELGTGKSLTARVIHSISDLQDGPLIVFNCAALPHEMIIPELQGTLPKSSKQGKSHISKFELANGGMLYFQDIDLLPLEGQEILLRYLKTGTIQPPGSNHRSEVQVRILAATCGSLEDLVGEGKFNAELLRWLSVFQIELPPLRARKEDIPVLANHILMRFSCRYRSSLDLAPDSLSMLCNYDWPGNIRELELIMERAVYCLGNECVIKPAHLPLSLAKLPGMSLVEHPPERAQPLTELQEEALIQAAKDCNGNLSEIARVLGIGRTTVWRWFKRMNISPDSFRSNGLER